MNTPTGWDALPVIAQAASKTLRMVAELGIILVIVVAIMTVVAVGIHHLIGGGVR